MAIRHFELDDIGEVRIQKRAGTRNLRVSITSKGEVRVSIPAWAGSQQGLDFALSKREWILQHLPDAPAPLQHGHQIGKAHRLVFDIAAVDTPSSRLAGTEIRIIRPSGMAVTHPAVQRAAERASIRALRTQAGILLPQRLQHLARDHGFSYAGVSIKRLSGRWGSCDNKQHIVLNLFLMQLPWHLIDYVLMHELTHTRHLNHSDDFWQEFLRHEPRAKELRRQIRAHKPVLTPA